MANSWRPGRRHGAALAWHERVRAGRGGVSGSAEQVNRATGNSTNEGTDMRTQSCSSMRFVPAIAAFLSCGLLGIPLTAFADGADQYAEASLIRRGFEIAPVPLNLRGRNAALVGLGSYLVNAVADCNGCHSAGPASEYGPGGNPYFKGNPPAIVNQSTYLGGGRNFGSLIPGTPQIVSRNLTPDRTGHPAGGRTFEEFLQILRTGSDLDGLHPNCSSTVTVNCFQALQPFNGDLLQVMPWPTYQNMSYRSVRAIYEYLSAIPCIPGPASGVLHNDCT